jgi:Domain of unknown function (DUF4129)
VATDGGLGRLVARYGRLATAAGLIALVALGLAVAGSPGSLRLGDPAAWLATVLIIVAAGLLGWAGAVLLWRHHSDRPKSTREQVDRSGWPMLALILVVVAGIGWALSQLPAGKGKPLPTVTPPPRLSTGLKSKPGTGSGGADLHPGPWLVIALGIAVLGVLGWAALQRIRSNRYIAPVELLPGDPLIAAIEAALLDLDNEPDPRRAVIKAYARTESVLRAHGLPRQPAEAPLEYLDRVLRELGGQAGAVDRLTVLFERAAFSKHEIGPEMREEAIAAFHGLRDELSVAPGDAS